MYCPNCGKENRDGSRQCVHCGYVMQTETLSASSYGGQGGYGGQSGYGSQGGYGGQSGYGSQGGYSGQSGSGGGDGDRNLLRILIAATLVLAVVFFGMMITIVRGKTNSVSGDTVASVGEDANSVNLQEDSSSSAGDDQSAVQADGESAADSQGTAGGSAGGQENNEEQTMDLQAASDTAGDVQTPGTQTSDMQTSDTHTSDVQSDGPLTAMQDSQDAVNDTSDTEESQEAVSPQDPPGDYYHYGGHTYGFYYTDDYGLNSYQEVVEFCRKQGGHLAVINDQEENDFLFSLVESNFATTAFFGYTDEGNSEGSWYWTDGDSSYTNWTNNGSQHQPDNGSGYGGDEDYAEFNYERNTNSPNDGTWNDAPFTDNTTRFICEWDSIL